jgi:serine/threonine protein kinase
VAERQFGPYRLIRQIAVGGMAEIHLAKTAGIAGFEKYVALKMIHPNFAEDEQFIQMLVDEAKIAVQLTHGNIAQTFDLGRVGETYYITMEYVDGADLYKLLRRASEQDLDMPLDVCAFIGKQISSALDHAHRKRDHTGASLGIVHRDVSPQNVLVSYSGEVKLVDFGIAKATMKARQTAVGVIKGKYYYMSPEQAWGAPIDHRSDIFSAGIVVYEMITGQMLYLEEDLHKLLELARSAQIEPPSKLRRGVPPQLERIVMNALAKQPQDRYQTAGDFATDLERFLHAYSPVFTASKLSGLLRQVIGDPMQVPDDAPFPSIEFRDGVMSTHPIDDAEVAHAMDRDDLRDENSVLFRVSELQPPREPAPAPAVAPGPALPRQRTPPPLPVARPPTPAAASSGVVTRRPADAAGSPVAPAGAPRARQIAPRVTRATDPLPAIPRATGRIPSIVAPHVPAKIPTLVKPRDALEETRPLVTPAPPNPAHDEGSGLLTPEGERLSWDDPELDNLADRTVVTAAPIGASTPGLAGLSGFMLDFAADDGDGPEATLITQAPTGPGFGHDDAPAERPLDDDGPTVARELAVPTGAARARPKAGSPAALAANIHAPALSELRRPRASRKTPPGGSPVQASVLHAIVSSQVSEAMPTPRAAPRNDLASMPMPSQMATQLHPSQPFPATLPHDAYAQQFPNGTPGAQAQYATDASGLPMGLPTPPGMSSYDNPPSHYPSPYAPPYGGNPGYDPQVPTQMSPHGYPQLSPGALYQFQPPQQQPMSLTGQMRLLEVDELPAQYKLGSARRRLLTYLGSGLLAVSVAAAVTFLIIRSMRTAPLAIGSVQVQSVPAGADVLFDGTRLDTKTPVTIDQVRGGTRHAIRVELARHTAYSGSVEIPKLGGPVDVMAILKPITGKILIDSVPSNAEVQINGQVRGRTPATISDVDIDSAHRIEVRLKGYQPFVQELVWPADGKIHINAKLSL